MHEVWGIWSVYFAHSYSYGERETNEKKNSLARRFISKGKDIATVSDYTVQKIENWINNLPRRILGYRTSEELFRRHFNRIISAA